MSEEEEKELFGVRVKRGDGMGETGEPNSEVVLEAGVILLLLVGLSGVRNSCCI